MSDIAFHITDVTNNSLAAGANRIGVEVTLRDGELMVVVWDNGCGMESEILGRVTDPFFTSRTTRHVGLGIPLLCQAAEMTGGSVTIESQAGCGTRIEAVFLTGDVDCPPAGDIPEAIALLISGTAGVDLNVTFTCGTRCFKTSSGQLARIFGTVPLGIPAVASAIQEFISFNFEDVFAGRLPV